MSEYFLLPLLSLMIGTGIFIFLRGLEWSVQFFQHNPFLVYLLPLAGLFVAWAGAVFALEHPGSFRRGLWKQIPLLLLISWGSFWVATALGLTHPSYVVGDSFVASRYLLPWLEVSLIFVIVALVYQSLYFRLQAIFAKAPRWAALLLGGFFLSGAALLLSSTQWHGLGTGLLDKSLHSSVENFESFLKMFLTLLTNAAGFLGGEVVPLMASGALLGNSLAQLLDLPLSLVAGAGIAVIFSFRLRCPAAGFIFLIERVSFSSAQFASLSLLIIALLVHRPTKSSSQTQH